LQPLVRKDIEWLTRALRGLGVRELAVTTNGVSPWPRYQQLVDAGMTHFNVSLDTLRPDRFARVTRRPAKLLDTVLNTIDRLLEAR
jgi:GTP 3',8-cyclase